VPATLASLRIQNLALVEDLDWQLARGFVAVTGETGSGKSIILGALKLVLGERADKSLIRTGADSCSVEAVFHLDETGSLNARLEAQGIEPCADSQLIVKRVFTRAGANRQFVNCSATTLAALKELGDGLVDLHGPHDHQSLLSAEKQMALLDSFAGAEPLRAEFHELFKKLNAVTAEHDELATGEAALEREVDLLRHQVREIESANLGADEEEMLLARYNTASHSRRLIDLTTQILDRLSESDDSALSRLGDIQRSLREVEKLDPSAAKLAASHADAVAQLDDIARDLQHYASGLDTDPEQLAQLEERVSLVESLKRKYGRTVADVIAFGDSAAERLRKIESRGDELKRLAAEIEKTRAAMLAAGRKLSDKRHKTAPKLASEITAQLRGLGFAKSDFTIALSPLEQPGAAGLESAEFLFAPNPGEPPKPLRAIASSGEISRVMLAVKSVLAAQDRVALLVFDEIDANVGGEIAHAVADKMRELGRRHQVLCITHLPQVAAAADSQFVVTKAYGKDKTTSQLAEVAGDARTEEIARMLGGKGASALAHARTLLEK
jgi:DNA repair protein RecN (Recombination protein N)